LIAATALAMLNVVSVSAVRAQEFPDYLGDVTITSATIDVHTGVPTITGTVECLLDASLVRIRAALVQRDASSTQVGGTTCVAGQVASFTIVFGPQQGRFHPGPAQLSAGAEIIGLEFEGFLIEGLIFRPA
jgi:hypothetical protein